jgi:hypothetical protein
LQRVRPKLWTWRRIDHLERPLGFVLKAMMETSTVTPSFFTVRESPD